MDGAQARRRFDLPSVALLAYLARDPFAAVWRYGLDGSPLSGVWFVPDLLALGCVALFVREHVLARQNFLALATVGYLGFAAFIGVLFFENFAAPLAAVKMMAPVFVGFCFCGASLGARPWLRRAVELVLYLTLLGIFLSSLVSLPWVGYEAELFGMQRQAGRLWWTGGAPRLSGFAADSTMAAFFVLVPFALASVYRGGLWALAFGAAGLAAVALTTNKTCLGALALWLAVLFALAFLPPSRRVAALRGLTRLSFAALALPPLLVALLSGANLARLDPRLFSFQDRIDNSWQKPFRFMAELMPTGFVTGCGLGCFNTPHQALAPHLQRFYVPVDNFYIASFLMLGLPFLGFVACLFAAVRRMDDPAKLAMLFVMNVLTITVLGYSPATSLLVMGFAFSEVFAGRPAAVGFKRPSRFEAKLGAPAAP